MTPRAIAQLLEGHVLNDDWESGYAWCECGHNFDRYSERKSEWAEHVAGLIAVGHAH